MINKPVDASRRKFIVGAGGLLVPVLWPRIARPWGVVEITGAPAGGGGTLTYFGFTDTPVFINTSNGYTLRNENKVWTCPGTGSVPVVSLQGYCSISTGNPNVRLAIYTTGNAFVMQGSVEVVVPASEAWTGHTSFVDQAGSPIASPTLTGGTNYILCMSFDGDINYYGTTTHGADDCSYHMTEYTAGFPATLGGSSGGTTNWYAIRCGVTV